MSNRGIQEFCYTRNIPDRAIKIAEIITKPYTPAQLVDESNTPYQQGSLGIWKSGSSLAGAADFIAADYNQSKLINGDSGYYIENQFFELTNKVTGSTPLYFYHTLPAGVTGITILDLAGNVQTDAAFLIENQYLYHDMDKKPYRVRYVDSYGFLKVQLLNYNPVLGRAPYSPSAKTFVYASRFLSVVSTGNFYIRFLEPNGYLIRPPYNSLPNTPWFARISFGLKPIAPEWAKQVFLPQRPYIFASWVPGIVLDTHLIELERKQMFLDPAHLPDILVFDKDYAIKYALEGSLPGSPRRRGGLYPWKRGLIPLENIDAYNSRLELSVELDPTDIIYAFYSYVEQDVIYRGLDINPYTNPNIKNRVVKFYFKSNGQDPFKYIYHQVLDDTGANISTLTNDPAPGTGTNIEFGRLVVGANIGTGQFQVVDSRELGGGLDKEFQNIPEAVHFWDLGYWDGKPYPAGGGMMIHLPQSLLDKMSKADIESKIASILPLGVLPVIFYYDNNGIEIR